MVLKCRHCCHDALVPAELLQATQRNAEIIYAGKRGGIGSSNKQTFRSALLNLRARTRVLRLKATPTYSVGAVRKLALVEAGAFSRDSGISAGVGGLAYAGIPITHRTTNSVVTFMTGHDAKGTTPSSVNWEAVAAGSTVLVLYMALRNLNEICNHLRKAGRSTAEPVALISNATLPNQRVLETTLGHASAVATKEEIKSPLLVVIGEVVRLRESLNWLGLEKNTAD